MDNCSMVCNNKKVWDFYKSHPNIDFEHTNTLFVDLMSSLYEDMNNSLNSSVANQLFEKINGIRDEISNVNNNVLKLQSDIMINFNTKLGEFKKEYMDDVKMVLTNNTVDKLAPLMKEFNYSLLDKTHLMINELIPKHHDIIMKQIRELIQTFNTSINEDTTKLINSTITQQSLNDFVSNIETKLTNTINTSNQIVTSMISTSDQKINGQIADIKNNVNDNTATQNTLHGNISDLLRKMEVSSIKGKWSENILFNMIQSMYPSAQITSVGDQKETGDIMLVRKNKPTILIENKTWNKNVTQDEVKKFIRDVDTQKCCGLFLSQNCGIANKENFEINIHDRNILLYVHEANNDFEKIKVAIDIIDSFKNKLDEIVVMDDNYTIDKELLDEINKEYQYFATQQMAQIKLIKDFSQKMIKQIDESQLPSLKKYLSTKYAFSTSNYVCEVCEYVAKNQSALAAHKRGKECKNKGADVIVPDQQTCKNTI